MTAPGVYVLGAVLAWPVLVFVLAGRFNHLRRGPSLATVAVLAVLAALVWPLTAVALFVAPSPERHR